MIPRGTFTVADLVDRRSRSATVCVPARNEAETIGRTVRTLVALRERGAIDDVVVLAGDSSDGTEDLAAEAGATVDDVGARHPELGPVLGKGDAMWRGLESVTTDLVAFVDADLTTDLDAMVGGLLGPLLRDSAVRFVKGAFRRHNADFISDEDPYDGGRVTETVARPLINLLRPDLAGFYQPLGGQIGAEVDLLRSITFLTGYAVEIGMLLDVVDLVGLDAVAQVDLGDLENRPRTTTELAPMSQEVLYGFLLRAAPDAVAGGWRPYVRPHLEGGYDVASASVVERPPLGSRRSSTAS